MKERNPKTERRWRVIIKSIFGLAVASFSAFLMWYEFGIEIFQNDVFIGILFLWLMYGFFLLWGEWDKAGEKSTSEKIDDLINEIRQDRNERKDRDSKQ